VAPSKDNTPLWSVVIVVFNDRGHVLSLTRNFDLRDLAMPGGHCAAVDVDPQQTAIRVLQEETGLRVKTYADALQISDPIADWVGDLGQPVYAFRVYDVGGKLRTSKGKPVWVRPKMLFAASCTFREKARELLEPFIQEQDEEPEE
jgi:8-oxo-dGTP pyrophosphatase MutT (NUDIX family)